MIDELLRTWHDPHARHAALVHVPIALGLLGIAPVLWLGLTKFRSRTPAIVCIAWFLTAAFGAFLASQAGEAAEPTLASARVPISEAEAAAVKSHEQVGEKVWMWALATALCCGATQINVKRARIIAGALATISAIGCAGWTSYAAHLGGRLVYVHALGVPERHP